ncbi:MAG TPA: Mor transcription activator family protein [Methylophilaceae bacterium]|nr:Mor transcription activator family protein [Methylophilaceae bacterium]
MSKKQKHSVAAEFLEDLIYFNKQVLMAAGIEEEKATVMSRDTAKKMCDEWGGQIIYFPKWLRAGLSDRDMQLWNEFNGKNQSELARKYNLSIQNVYRIIDFMRVQETAKRQGQLTL